MEEQSNRDRDKTTIPTPSSEAFDFDLLDDKIRRIRSTLSPADRAKPIGEILAEYDLAPQLTAEQIAERERTDEERRAATERNAKRQRLAFLGQAVGARYAECSLDSFTVSTDEQRRVVGLLKQFADGLEQHVPAGAGLLLFGPKGTGKDHLLVAMLRKAVLSGFPVQWRNGGDLFGEIRDRMDGSKTEEQFIRDLTEPTILAISDPLPPAGSLTEWQAGMLFRILDRRYRAMKPTWATLNVGSGKEAEERMAGQLVDRLKDGAVCLGCNWPSYRKELKL